MSVYGVESFTIHAGNFLQKLTPFLALNNTTVCYAQPLKVSDPFIHIIIIVVNNMYTSVIGICNMVPMFPHTTGNIDGGKHAYYGYFGSIGFSFCPNMTFGVPNES